MNLPYEMYTSGDYLKYNPSWDQEDCIWKASFVIDLLKTNQLNPNSICEIGCGSGGVLTELRKVYPNIDLYGYDIAPDLADFWSQQERANIKFQLGDFFTLNKKKYDVILLLDVIEHVADPLAFLCNLHGLAKYWILHIPLDLSASTVLREKPILEQRRKVGHIHYFTKNLALSLLKECKYEVIEWRYSGIAFSGLHSTWKTKLVSLPRRLGYALNKDWGVRALGGETLFVLAKEQN